jgi:hypothetical protein
MQRGSSLELTLTGTNLAEPTGLWTSFPATVVIPTDKNNGKNSGKLRVQMHVPADAPLGFHSLRLATTRGISNFRLFCIDDLPQILEVDSNRSKETPQTLPVPCVVVGRADAETSDHYRIIVRAGQRVSFEILGRRLGSAFDPQITLFDQHTGKELPGGHNNDSPGLQTDCRLTYTFKEAGECRVEVRDTLWRGGPDFWYRLRIGDFPCATTPLPMAARRGSQLTVHFAGPMVDGVAPVEVAVPRDPAITSVSIAPRGANGLYGWPVVLAVSDHEEAMEQEPNNEPSRANRIAVPGGISARFLEHGDVDHFVFAGKKGQRCVIEAHTHELHSPTEVYMVLKDAKGSQLAASDPQAAPRIDFTPPADGDYALLVEHLIYSSGPAESYRVTVIPYHPDFDLSLGTDRFDVPPGGATPVNLFVTRHDYAGPIEVQVVGHPFLHGQATVPTGQGALPTQRPNRRAAPSQPAATLYLTAAPDVLPGAYDVSLLASATINGRLVSHFVNLRQLVSQNLASLSFPPHELFHQIGVGVLEKPPFTLAAHFDQAEGIRGAPVPLTITAKREAGFAGEIAMSPVGLPPHVTPALKSIPAGQDTIQAALTPEASAALGAFPVSFTGKANFQNKEFSVTAPPISLTLALPFDLQTEGTPIQLAPGGKTKFKVTAHRRGPFSSPISLAVSNLPGGVTATSGVIAAGQSAIELEVSAAANAALGDKSDVSVQGTATAASNQQNASAKFTVRVRRASPMTLPKVPGKKGQ